MPLRRPDTLELEVLSAGNQLDYNSAEDYDADNEFGCITLARPSATRDTSATATTTAAAAAASSSAMTNVTTTLSLQNLSRRTRWFHFGHKSRRRRRHRSRLYETDGDDDDDETTKIAIEKPNVMSQKNQLPALLAQPELTTIANSSNTIATSLPMTPITDDNSYRADNMLSHNGNDSVYSLTALTHLDNNDDHDDDNENNFMDQQLQKSEPNILNLIINDGPANNNNTNNRPANYIGATNSYQANLPIATAPEAPQATTPTNPIPTTTTTTHGLRANLLYFLDKLAIWKHSNCWPMSTTLNTVNNNNDEESERHSRRCRQRHRRNSSRLQCSNNTIDGSGLIVEAESDVHTETSTRKAINISTDFEQISTATSTSIGEQEHVKKRRLSQMKRRRSSYYFSENERRIRANDKEFNTQFKYHNNYIKTSKYSLFTFLPFNLLEQFQRLANFYFLCLLVLQLIPAISSLTPVTTAIPLIGVLTLTAVKDAYDDIQRHISDSQVNNRKSKTLRNGKLVQAKWSEVQVGDVIRLENNQFVAADILLLTTSEPNGLCFIETAELDGETNLKCKQCLPETIELGEQHDLLWSFNGEIICERPNNLLNKFDGTLLWKNQRFALDNEKILLRGCVLRNTQWCYGVVVFAGIDTKLMQNSGKTQFKSTGVDRLLNFIIIGIVLFLISICAFFAVACAIWESLIGQHFQVFLPWENIIPKDITTGSTVIGLLVFFSYAIVLNTVVPISLYVSVEVIRFAQSFLINWDEEMYDPNTNTYAKARTTTLNEELGQIQYIFSDKTGTLTQNIMTFNKCSINGRNYGDIIDLQTGEVIEITDAIQPVDFSSNPQSESDFRWYDRTLLDAVRSDEEHSHNFFRLLSLCHTVMAETVDGKLEYQAQSPDEAALVSAARNFGFVFRSRTPNSITIEVMGRKEEYELLNILDFNNVRKRMSVILRRNNSVVLYCKGADNVIYDRLHNGQDDLKARTQDHLNKFAGEGLRTLVLAERRLTADYYNDWRERQQEAALSLDNREQKLNAIYEEIESDMSLIGVTAIEDKLQDGVPKSIANLQNAGIKIWVLTGDKQETAINIGYSCQLLTDELADVFIVDGSSVEEVEKQLRNFKESIKIFNRFRPGGLEAMNLSNANNTMDNIFNNATIPNPNQNQNQKQNNNPSAASTSAFIDDLDDAMVTHMAPLAPTQPPAISVVTFRWDAKIKDNKGGPDSAECNEFHDDMEKEEERLSAIVDENTGFALVVNGHSLVYCLSPELEAKFLEIASQCKAVICCRVTPLQKALVVELIKRAKNAVTLAIGDGANDVSMIKAAHIGVGISGQEGLQAVLASDYSIAQFRFLERLLLVHGRWSYYRMCKFLRYFFYKNFAFTLCHCWYSLFCGFSAQTVFDPMFISVYNLFYTSLPVLALGVFEQDVSDKNSIDYPRLYTPGLKSELFNIREFIYSVLHGCFTSLILFLIPYGAYIDGIAANGLILNDHMTLGAVVATILIVDNTAQIALYTSYWTIVNHVTIWGSLVTYFVLDYFYNYVIGGPYVGSLTQAIKDLTFWVTMLITVVVLMAPVLSYKFYLLDVHPSLSDKIRQKSIQAISRQLSDVKRTPSARRGRRSVRSGYAFAHQEGFGRLITSGKIMHKLPQDFAFPLGLGTKKTQALHNADANNAVLRDPNGKQHQQQTTHTNHYQHNNNNTNLRQNQNHSSMADLHAYNENGGIGSNGDLSPRAPCQDLDTINL